MGYVKADEFFKVHSGQAIDDLQAQMADADLSINQAELIGWRITKAEVQIKEIEAKIIDKQGNEHTFIVPVSGSIIYNPLPKEVT